MIGGKRGKRKEGAMIFVWEEVGKKIVVLYHRRGSPSHLLGRGGNRFSESQKKKKERGGGEKQLLTPYEKGGKKNPSREEGKEEEKILPNRHGGKAEGENS